MGRADRVRRERPSHRPEFRPRRTAGPDAPASSFACGWPCRARLALASCLLWACLAVALAGLAAPAQAQTTVPGDWTLIPAGLGAGDQFRIIFVTSTDRNATSPIINDYNTFVQNRAAAGHSAIQAYSDGFRVVGCTAAVDARDNTSTTSSDTGVPIYWLNGNKVADDYEDFYDGSWDDEANLKDESGEDRGLSGFGFVFTGCYGDGSTADSFHLGARSVAVGAPGSNDGPIDSNGSARQDRPLPIYGLSGVFQVFGATDATLRDLVLTDANAHTVALSDSFEPTITSYTADVDNAVDTITVTPTVSHSGAKVSYPDTTDASEMDDGHQVALTSGENVITVTVTAEDGVTTRTYTVTVTVNTAPTVADAIPDQTAAAGRGFSYIFPATTFSDADSDVLSYTATRSDDSALPTWLDFTDSSRTFSGTPQASNVGTLTVKVTANDGNGGMVDDEFDIVVAATDVCLRTPAVRDAIVDKVSGVSDCADLMPDQLADDITGRLDLADEGLTSLQAGDFGGLTALTELDLSGNALSRLGGNVFGGSRR